MSRKAKSPTYTRAHAEIVDYLLAYGMSQVQDPGDTRDRTRTWGGMIGFVSCLLSDGPKPQAGDLILLKSGPVGKWRLSWLLEARPLNGDRQYLCKSIVDGELCWWSNISVSYLHRPELEQHPHWRWSDEQFAFNDRWHKACARHDPYLYRPRPVVFNDDGTATLSTRVRHDWHDLKPSMVVPNWRKITLKALAAIYLEFVEQHKAYKKD